ncbi:energy transducer TonB [Aliarcobacter cibarius]|jgi:periplasmic protein TonB|uniref:Energy transducer TonB n=1 Tax=Aliarcobacter cibarius TaxID=255507 RepID=A0A5J6RJD2_9BACT|nr:energy transducer TonB [Aliarcobacter cibarius]QEZ89543.1 energy transduction protein TonB [Aliarcobacter cibarius]QKJ27543.1 energy transduction protein TonB [Aliarcobacter cibarius]TLS96165.1 energy transducer TonB [Aliarcobacter cibarius]TLS96685.1 energy transducer TonB [Aliarcobacter cibarius]TLT04434.1 energy transducer TonB [Aliarcobacter cibarius]
MKRYLNSFFITSFLYSMVGAIFLYAMSEIKIEPKKEEIITKISLNSVAVQKIEKKIVEPIIEQKPEPVIEKIVEKPAPKVIEKTKKVEKVVKKEKPIEKIVEKPVEKVAEKTEKSIEENPVVTQTTPNTNPVIESISKAQIDSIEDAYLSKVKAKIEKNKVYPKIAKRLNQTGKVVVSFDILKDGKVINIRIIQNSKFEKLDEASIELLTKIGFFEAIPNELNKTVWNIQIPINYQIN